MTDKVIENNQVVIMGRIVSNFTYSHEIFGEGFYMVDVEVARLSESYDIIPIMVSERLIDVDEDYRDAYVSISGQFRSYNRHEERKNKLILSVFAREINWRKVPGPIRFIWTVISAKSLFTAKHRWAERLRMFCWQSTVLMENQIISPASAGGEMHAMPVRLRWVPTVRSGAGSKAGNI